MTIFFQGYTAVMLACLQNSQEILKTLLQKRPNLELVNQKGETALVLAMEEGNDECVNLPLRYGCEVDTRSPQTPLTMAVEADNLPMIEVKKIKFFFKVFNFFSKQKN